MSDDKLQLICRCCDTIFDVCTMPIDVDAVVKAINASKCPTCRTSGRTAHLKLESFSYMAKQKMNERNTEIIRLWNDGVAARDIVRRMGVGVTKNVIIGVVNRNRDLITRPMIYCNRQKGLMSSFVRWGMKRRMDRNEKA
jgi:hypothetical protein